MAKEKDLANMASHELAALTKAEYHERMAAIKKAQQKAEAANVKKQKDHDALAQTRHFEIEAARKRAVPRYQNKAMDPGAVEPEPEPEKPKRKRKKKDDDEA